MNGASVVQSPAGQAGLDIGGAFVGDPALGSQVASLASLFGGGGPPGIAKAQNVVVRWYVWGLQRDPDISGQHHWVNEINANQAFGPSYANFSAAPESQQKGFAQRMRQYEALGYGGYDEDVGEASSKVAPPLTAFALTDLRGATGPAATRAIQITPGDSGARPAQGVLTIAQPSTIAEIRRNAAAGQPSALMVPWYKTPLGMGGIAVVVLLVLVVVIKKVS